MNHDVFYVRPQDVSDGTLVFRGDENGHLVRAMRKRAGDAVLAVDGRGRAYQVRILKTGKGETTAEITGVHERSGERDIELTLAQGLIKGGRLDWLVEKASEIGVHAIVPVRTANSVLKTLSPQRMARLQKIALSAMKQSGRSFLPGIAPVTAFDDVLGSSSVFDVRLIAHPAPRGGPGAPIPRGRRILCLVGPEGGFEPLEVEKALECGFLAVSLGPARLRAETAGIVLLARVFSPC
jgi:16S rRNA (uracil1498-N3)-methyltransferase